MRALLVCLVGLLASLPVHAQVSVGVDLGQAEGNYSVWSGFSGSAFVTAQRGVLFARANVIEWIHEGVFRPDERGTALVQTETASSASSSLELGVSVPVYRGVGIGATAGGRLLYNSAELSEQFRESVSRGAFTSVEVFALGPRGTRLHVRAEGFPTPAVNLRRVQAGVSLPLRF